MQCESCNHLNVDGARFCAKCGNLMPVADEAAEDKLIGQIIGGRYRVTGVLGEGGMGIVYIGEQQMGSTIRQVAIKTLHQHLSKDPSVLARFHRECGTVAQLEHPNTIKFYDFGSTADGTLYIAMEFVKGKPLNEVIEGGGPMLPERVMKIMKQVCGALDEAHKQGIIHRDLKPENLILTDRAGETDFVKVLDFGIAARSESADAQKEQKLTQQGMVLGTPPYMSPEQFTGKALDARSDIYSLGVMTYEMLTSKLPFEADTPWQWATQHMTAQPLPFEVTAPSQEIPEHIRKAILRAMSKNREERQDTAKDFYGDLSHGGGITVVEAPRSEVATQGTAAMAAAPDFAAFGTPVPSSPHAVPPHSPPVAHHPPPVAPPMAMPPAHVPMAPPRQQSSGGGKGLVIGLGALGVVLLLAIVVVAVAKMKSPDDEPLTNPFNSGVTGTTTVAPLDSAAVGNGGGTSVDPPAEDAGTVPTAKTNTTTTKPTASNTTKVPNAQACDACLAAAQGGNIGGASAAYAKCTDPAKKSACSAHAKARAPAAAKAAAMNGNCAQAKGIQNAASAMGAGSGALSGALNGTKCK
jgi:serine/threonine protein kinase